MAREVIAQNFSNANTSRGHVRHLKYYLSDGNTIILVGNTLFNVHRSILCRDENSDFTSIFRPSPGSPQGSADDDPILLPPTVKASSFANLLCVMYSSAFCGNINPQILNSREWIEVLDLTSKFSLTSVTQVAASSIENYGCTVTPDFLVDHLAIAFRHPSSFSPTYLNQLFKQLCLRDASLTLEDGNKLGGPLTALVARCRELLLRGHDGVLKRDTSIEWCNTTVAAFEEELKKLRF